MLAVQLLLIAGSIFLYAKAEKVAHLVHGKQTQEYQRILSLLVDALQDLDYGAIYYNGGVAAEHPRCSEIGAEIMKRGGNAVDATIASLLCVGVVHNFASGLGGGGFMLVKRPDGHSEVIDFRETAPKSAHRDMFNQNKTLATDSTLAFAVPGEVRGIHLAHSRHGRLPWRELFQPNIDLCRQGFLVNEKMQDMLHRFKSHLKRSPAMVETYFRDDGTPKEKGDLIIRPNLARTLELIAEKGPDVFYEGEIAERLVSFVNEHEGGVTMEDMRTYEPIIREPIHGQYEGFDVITTGAPTSGPILIEILQILDKLTLPGDEMNSESRQKIIEAFKFAYVDRMKLGDPAFVANVTDIVNELISCERACSIAPRIHGNQTFPPEYYLSEDTKWDAKELHGTTHVSAADKDGYVASATSTVNLEWGCRLMEPVTGIILNNEMDDFSIPNADNSFGLPPSEANFIAPGKRPLSSAAPTMVFRDGHLAIVIGGAGGSRIVTAIAQTILEIIAFGMHPVAAVRDCRLHHQLSPNLILAESRCDHGLLDSLKGYGHKMLIMAAKKYASAVYMVQRLPDGGFIPVSDDRKGGVSAGV